MCLGRRRVIEMLMSVTRAVKATKQPRGGYLNPKKMNVVQLNDGKVLAGVENIYAGTVGTAVDYLSRYVTSGDAETAFHISLLGAQKAGQEEYARRLLACLDKKLSDACVTAACQLVGYDVVYRAGKELMTPVDEILPDYATIENVRIMVNRSTAFFNQYGPVLADGFVFGWQDPNQRFPQGGYTLKVASGDGDFLTDGILWDFKVSKNPPTKDHTLQLLMYAVMAIVAHGRYMTLKAAGQLFGEIPVYIEHGFDAIRQIGIFNPRLNQVYTYDLASDIGLLEAIGLGVIEYGSDIYDPAVELPVLEWATVYISQHFN